jgi:hypothetical protein
MTSTKPKLEPVYTTDQTTLSPDPFNAEALRLPPSFEQTAGIKKLITTIQARKPHSQEWIRVHPDTRISRRLRHHLPKGISRVLSAKAGDRRGAAERADRRDDLHGDDPQWRALPLAGEARRF